MQEKPTPPPQARPERDWSTILFLAFIAFYLILQGLILPAAGIPT